MYHKVKAEIIQSLKSASVAQQAKMYFKFHVKLKRAVQNIWFNQQCIKNNITPKYVQVKVNSNSIAAKKTQTTMKKYFIKEETKSWFITRNVLKIYLKVLHSELTYHLHAVEFDLLDDLV